MCSFILPSGQGIGDGIQVARSILHHKIIAKKLTHPMMLRHRRKTLVEQKFQGIMVCPYCERTPPKVWPPVSNRLDQAYQLALICSQLQMTGGKRSAEVGQGA